MIHVYFYRCWLHCSRATDKSFGQLSNFDLNRVNNLLFTPYNIMNCLFCTKHNLRSKSVNNSSNISLVNSQGSTIASVTKLVIMRRHMLWFVSTDNEKQPCRVLICPCISCFESFGEKILLCKRKLFSLLDLCIDPVYFIGQYRYQSTLFTRSIHHTYRPLCLLYAGNQQKQTYEKK